jgi:transcriptional regulator with XRE-family HTH domain
MTKEAKERFGSNLKELREGRGLSQQALADRAGVPYHSVSRLERQQRSPSLDEALALCAALGVRIEHLAPKEARLAVEHQWALDELLHLARQLPTDQVRKLIAQVGVALERPKAPRPRSRARRSR